MRGALFFGLFGMLAAMLVTGACDDLINITLSPYFTDEANSAAGELANAEGSATVPRLRAEDGAFVLGYPNAPVTLVLFEDFVCSHCLMYEPTVSQFITDYVTTGEAKLEYRMYPTAGGDYTYFADQIAECTEEQREGAFWDAREVLINLAHADKYAVDLGERVASALNMDYDRMLDCTATAQQVDVDMAFGRALGISGTPAVRMRYNDGPAEIIIHNGLSIPAGGVLIDYLDDLMADAGS